MSMFLTVGQTDTSSKHRPPAVLSHVSPNKLAFSQWLAKHATIKKKLKYTINDTIVIFFFLFMLTSTDTWYMNQQ